MNRKPLNQPRKEPKPEVPVKGFEIFKDGKFNLRPPHNFNWALGHVTPPPPEPRRTLKVNIGLPNQTVNGQRVVQ